MPLLDNVIIGFGSAVVIGFVVWLIVQSVQSAKKTSSAPSSGSASKETAGSVSTPVFVPAPEAAPLPVAQPPADPAPLLTPTSTQPQITQPQAAGPAPTVPGPDSTQIQTAPAAPVPQQPTTGGQLPAAMHPAPVNEWQCVPGWNGPIRYKDGVIQCIGTTACHPVSSSATCVSMASRLNTEPSFLAGVESLRQLFSCAAGSGQPPCNYTVQQGKITPAKGKPAPNQWQCLPGWNGPVKFENGIVSCTGSYRCMEQSNAAECNVLAEKLRDLPGFEKMITEAENIRQCTPNQSGAIPCSFTESAFTGIVTDRPPVISSIDGLWGKPLILHMPTPYPSVGKLTAVFTVSGADAVRVDSKLYTNINGEIVEGAVSANGKIISKTTTSMTAQIEGETAPYRLSIIDGTKVRLEIADNVFEGTVAT